MDPPLLVETNRELRVGRSRRAIVPSQEMEKKKIDIKGEHHFEVRTELSEILPRPFILPSLLSLHGQFHPHISLLLSTVATNSARPEFRVQALAWRGARLRGRRAFPKGGALSGTKITTV